MQNKHERRCWSRKCKWFIFSSPLNIHIRTWHLYVFFFVKSLQYEKIAWVQNFWVKILKWKFRNWKHVLKKGILPVFFVTLFFIYMDLKALFLCRKNLLTELPIMSVPWKPCLDWYIIMENIKRCKFTHLLWEYVAHRWVKGF